MKKVRLCSCGQRPAVYFKFHRTYMCEECAKDSGILIPCPGEAHSNGFIDHCSVCMPRWGWVEKIPMQIRAEVLKEQPGTAIPVRLGAIFWLSAAGSGPNPSGPHLTVNYMSVSRETGAFYVQDDAAVSISHLAYVSRDNLMPEEALILSEALLMAACFAQSAIAKSSVGRLMLANPVYAPIYAQMMTELTAVRESIGEPL